MTPHQMGASLTFRNLFSFIMLILLIMSHFPFWVYITNAILAQ